MKKRGLLAILLVIFLLSAVSAELEKRYIVKFKSNEKVGLSLQPKIIKKINGPSEGLYVIRAQSEEELLARREVLSVEEDYQFKALSDETPWNFEAIGINFTELNGSFGQGVKIAVLDTGVNYNLLNVTSGYDFVNDNQDAFDDNGHGTLVSQIYKAPGTNLPLQQAEIYAIKVLNENGEGYDSDIIEAIYWAINNNIDIVSMSFGGSANSVNLDIAIAQAYAQGILFVAAAGNNDGELILYPAANNNVIATGSVNENLLQSGFSNYGQELELVAPGENILLTLDGLNYVPFQGTSFSAPHVGVVAAAILSENPASSNIQIRQALQNSALDLGQPGKDDSYGYGLVQYFPTNNSSPEGQLEQKVSALELWKQLIDSWKETVTTALDNLWLAIADLTSISEDHESRIIALESQGPPSFNASGEIFPEYLNYLSSSSRKKIVCGYGENHRLEHIEELGYTCDLTYKTLRSGRERIRCRCKRI